jgi:hypothetical protein
MRRIWTLTGAAVLALGLALAVPATAASAAGVQSVALGCSSAAYPPSPHATIMASTTTPSVGETIEASGTAYCADEDVRLTLAGRYVGTTHTDSTGAFDPPVTVHQTGKLRLCGIGASGLPNDRDCLILTVQAHNNNGGGGHNPGGGTSFTGTDILLLCVLAAALLAAGWALVALGRRRRLVETRS